MFVWTNVQRDTFLRFPHKIKLNKDYVHWGHLLRPPSGISWQKIFLKQHFILTKSVKKKSLVESEIVNIL